LNQLLSTKTHIFYKIKNIHLKAVLTFLWTKGISTLTRSIKSIIRYK